MPRRLRLLALVIVVGAASLGGEIATTRLLAPWFGDSTVIWANTIGTVLLALSTGYWLGGRLADRRPRIERLSEIVLVAAVLFALVPFLARPLLQESVSAFEALSVGAFIGSLLAVLALVAFPLVLLGTVAPYATRLAIERIEDAGRVTGRLYALSTLGSLAGVFLSALVLVPLVGTRRTFLAFALALALVAVTSLRLRWLLVPLAVGALIALPVGTVKATAGERVLWERETPYQYARVVEDASGERKLELNEGHGVHSVYIPGEWLTHRYWDQPLVLPFAVRTTTPRSVAILGDAAGTTARELGHFFPRTRVDGVDVDGALNDVGRRLFDLRGPRLHLHTADARAFLRASRRRWDVIVIDAYHQPYVPFHLATREFFALVRERLTPQGVALVNVSHPPDSDALERALTATLRDAFTTTLREPVGAGSTMLLASDAPASNALLRRAVAHLPPQLAELARGAAEELAPGLRGGPVFSDDHAPIEWLIDASIIGVATRGEG